MEEEEVFEKWSPLDEKTPYGRFYVYLSARTIVCDESAEVCMIVFSDKRYIGLYEKSIIAAYSLQKKEGVPYWVDVTCARVEYVLGRKVSGMAKFVPLPLSHPLEWNWEDTCRRLSVLAMMVTKNNELAASLASFWGIELQKADSSFSFKRKGL